jgi:hypothetical protein
LLKYGGISATSLFKQWKGLERRASSLRRRDGDEIEITEGVRIDRGFISPNFITDVKASKGRIRKILHPSLGEDLSSGYPALTRGYPNASKQF